MRLIRVILINTLALVVLGVALQKRLEVFPVALGGLWLIAGFLDAFLPSFRGSARVLTRLRARASGELPGAPEGALIPELRKARAERRADGA